MFVTYDHDLRLGALLSVVMHIALAWYLIFVVNPSARDFGQPVIYSITLEGGKSLGGIAQVPANDKKQAVAPPKVQGAEETRKEAERLKAEKDAEISLAEEKRLKEEKKAQELKKKEEEKTKALAEKKKAEEEKKKAEKLAREEKEQSEKQRKAMLQRYLGESSDAGGKGFGAARLGGSGMGGGVLVSPEYMQYLSTLKRSVKGGWRWYDTTSEIRAKAHFYIAENGVISDVSISQSSGNREFDESVIRAIYKASPLPPPPPSVYKQFSEVFMVFDPKED